MVTSVTSTTDTTAAAAAMKQSMGMNKDDFLKLFIAQLQYQDPLKPTDASAMLNQLSQLTQVEQAYNTNTNLQSMLAALNNSSSINSASLIGKNVMASGNQVAYDGLTPAYLQFSQSVPTTASTVSITDSTGRVVRTASIGPLSAGENAVAWDGRDSAGLPVPAGAYSFAVSGTTASGTALAAETFTTGRIDGINVANGTPVLTIGPVSVPLSSVISVKGV